MIGIFDSGFGGLAIFKEIIKILPDYNYIYLGDSAHTPYGNRSQEAIYRFTEQAVDFLFKRGCVLVIIACGTASAEALRKIQREYLPGVNTASGLPKNYPRRRVLGIIRPLVEEAIKVSRFGRIGVVGTRSTVESGAYERELRKLQINSKFEYQNSKQIQNSSSSPRDKVQNWRLDVYQRECPLLVPLVEEGWIKKPETRMILKKYLRPLKEKKIDTLILGCTHYSLLYKEFNRIMGRRCAVLDSGKIIAKSLRDYLKRHAEIESKLKRSRGAKDVEGRANIEAGRAFDANRIFYSTDNSVRFAKLGSGFLEEKFEAKKINLINS